jgi:hypothetical protein
VLAVEAALQDQVAVDEPRGDVCVMELNDRIGAPSLGEDVSGAELPNSTALLELSRARQPKMTLNQRQASPIEMSALRVELGYDDLHLGVDWNQSCHLTVA